MYDLLLVKLYGEDMEMLLLCHWPQLESIEPPHSLLFLSPLILSDRVSPFTLSSQWCFLSPCFFTSLSKPLVASYYSVHSVMWLKSRRTVVRCPLYRRRCCFGNGREIHTHLFGSLKKRSLITTPAYCSLLHTSVFVWGQVGVGVVPVGKLGSQPVPWDRSFQLLF